MLRYNFI